MLDELNELIALNEQGSVLELCEKYYADDVVMNSDGVLFASSMKEARDKQKKFVDRIENSHVKLESKSVTGNVSELIFHYEITTVDKTSISFKGKHIQTWQDGKIIKEDYFNIA